MRIEKCFLSDSNQRPIDLQSSALPSELRKPQTLKKKKKRREIKRGKSQEESEKKEKKWFHPDLNRGPSLRQSDVITNYTMKPSKRNTRERVLTV